jgi:hypothetical protein
LRTVVNQDPATTTGTMSGVVGTKGLARNPGLTGTTGKDAYSGEWSRINAPLTLFTLYQRRTNSFATRVSGNLTVSTNGYGFAPNTTNFRAIVSRSGVNTILTGSTTSNTLLKADALVIGPSNAELWENGVRTVAPTAHGGMATPSGSFTHGLENGASNCDSLEIYLSAVWSRELLASELKSLAANPWQIFQPIERQIFIADSAVEVVLADGLVTVDNATQVNTASTATIQQTHLVGVANSAQANTASSVGASQSSTVLVTVDSAAQTNTASASSVNQTHRIICAAVAIDNVASSSAIVQTHLVGAANSTASNTAAGVMVTQGSVHSVGAANASQANTASTVAVRVTHAVGAASSTQANTASNAAAKQTHLLTCAAAAVDNVASASRVVQTHLVGAASAAQANTASTVAVGDGSFIAAFGRTGVLLAESRTGQIPTEIRVGSLVVELRSGSI